ncbi:hypothetical protein HNP38_000825 [Chryseobacterium defluvii]|uniref:Endosialidase-like protein n=1 Tax=Chryseobacterium defluvii TaxID=160396 RepID=A0A840KDD3_9FLAO|nr:hypothetical protein [Chryseobacterium defluvii]MBB4805553.1 hypothetical protein [Chryseobacterium defluvii]
MRKLSISIAVLSGSFFLAQTGNVGINTSSPDSNAVLDVVSSDKGLLPPRVSLTSTSSASPLTAHVAGMIVYNTATAGDVTPALYYNDGTKWVLGGAGTPAATTNNLTTSGNTITSNVNGISSTAPAINTNSLSLSGTSLTGTVNGIASNSLDLTPAITAATTNTLVSGGTGNNTITSTVNGVSANTTAVKTVSNTSTGNSLSTTVNGIAGTTVPMINTNALSLSGTSLTGTVNGIASNSLDLTPAVTAATTHTLSVSGNTLTSNVNGVTPNVTVPNIYTANGTLTSARTVNTSSFLLSFVNGSSSTTINNTAAGNGMLSVGGSSRGYIRAIASGNTFADMFVDASSAAQYTAGGSISGMDVGTATGSATSLRLVTAGQGRMTVSGTTGNVAIGTNPTSNKLEVAGSVKATNFISNTTTYPDYVFEGYYQGKSAINPQYKFKKLEDVEGFIKENGHLPGYASIEEIREKEMTIDVSKNTITNMEKIEELYLYAIEQNKMIKELQEEIKVLKMKQK